MEVGIGRRAGRAPTPVELAEISLRNLFYNLFGYLVLSIHVPRCRRRCSPDCQLRHRRQPAERRDPRGSEHGSCKETTANLTIII